MASSIASPTKCTFCSNSSKYTCPRCHVPYCSSTCYKASVHAQCSEGFYREMVEKELRDGTVSEASRKKMVDILRRVEAGESVVGDEDKEPLDSDDDEDAVDLSIRMAGVDLNNSESVWENLTEEEREEFEQIVKKGEIMELIPPWSPWWEQVVRPVQELPPDQPSSPKAPPYAAGCPPLVDAPLLSAVMKSSPSPCIPFNVLNVLAAYVWTVRLFNGDHHESSIDATEAILLLSTVLAANSNFDEAAVAVESPKMEAQNHPWLMESEEFANTVKGDVVTILRGPSAADKTFYVRAALSEIHTLMSTCTAIVSKKKRSSGVRQGSFSSKFPDAKHLSQLKHTTLSSVKLAMKKVEFLLSYVKENSSAIVSLAPQS